MVSVYTPTIVPSDLNDPLKLQRWLSDELKLIATGMDAAQTVTLDPQFTVPVKPVEGVVYYADGVSWNPGRGEGYYGYVNGVWVKFDAAAGQFVDSAIATYSTNAALTTILPVDDTIPTITEGTEILSLSFTPKTITNKLRCRFSGEAALSGSLNAAAALYQGSTCLDAIYNSTGANEGTTLVLEAEYVPGVLTTQTIAVRVGPGIAGTLRMNGTSAGRIFGGISNATLVIEEIKV